jgi:hypothetical protein
VHTVESQSLYSNYIVKGEPLPEKPRRSERLEEYYSSDEFQKKRSQWHEPGTKIEIKGFGTSTIKAVKSIDHTCEDADAEKVVDLRSNKANPRYDRAYEEAKTMRKDRKKWELWKWENSHTNHVKPITPDKILQESENIPTFRNGRERISAYTRYLNEHGRTHYKKISEALGIPLGTLYRDIKIAERKGIIVNKNGFLTAITLAPEQYSVFGYHKMGFTFDKQISYEVYAASIKELNGKPIIMNHPGRSVKPHGNPEATVQTYMVIESSGDYFQHSELSELWQSIQESFNTNRFKLTSFELNIDVPLSGGKVEIWGVRFSRRGLEGFVRAYRKNMNTYRYIDLPIDLLDIGGISKPEELLPLLDCILGRYNAWKEIERLKAENRELRAENKKLKSNHGIKSKRWWN